MDLDWLELLHATLDRRATPETIATILYHDTPPGAFTPPQIRVLAQAASGYNRRPSDWLSLMPDDFERAGDCLGQLATAWRVFAEAPGHPAPHGLGLAVDPEDIASVAAFIDDVGGIIGWRHGMTWTDRLTAAQRRGGAVPEAWAGHRGYNKKVRVLVNLWRRAERMDARQRFRRAVLVGRSGFACDIGLERFRADPPAAAYIAYWVALKNRRRAFTLAGRGNPLDDIAEMLLARCGPAADWPMIAMACPRREVLARLGDEDLGQLAGAWWREMTAAAMTLAGQWAALTEALRGFARARGWDNPDAAEIDRTRMLVARGMDSDGWNTTAQAYNAARAGWLGCLAAAGLTRLTVPALPGKVMRLMAGDLAWWHQAATGSEAHPDSRVWAALPFPWDVAAGVARCGRDDVARACRAAGLDPAATGWTAPLAAGHARRFEPTAELVHGVAVGDPVWARALRAAGVFSGKPLAPARAAETFRLRAQAEAGGLVTGPLPAYSGGRYLGTVKGGNLTED